MRTPLQVLMDAVHQAILRLGAKEPQIAEDLTAAVKYVKKNSRTTAATPPEEVTLQSYLFAMEWGFKARERNWSIQKAHAEYAAMMKGGGDGRA